jgi:hypothetical protein
MDPDIVPLALAPSLVVKLLYTPICPKCIDFLSRWRNPIGTYSTDRQSTLSRRALIRLVDDYAETSTWTWNIGTLRDVSSQCRCCNFLIDVLDSTPWMRPTEEDYFQIQVRLVGSQHITPYQRTHAERKVTYSVNAESQLISQYKRYYRPRVQLFRMRTNPGLMSLEIGKRTMYTPEEFTFIHPAVQTRNELSGEPYSAEAFFGRPVSAYCDLALARTWFDTCTSMHQGKPEDTETRCSSDQFEERGADPDGCLPKPSVLIANFRLVDVDNRCIVQIATPTEYAALSYVWGNSKRLLLGKNNQKQLSTPGVLSSDNGNVPKTFLDALTVAQGLSIRFIWIDALCIMQDQPKEVIEHIDRMAMIYSAAILTIVSDTEGADSGLPGISVPRAPPQASFEWAGTMYLSARKTFGEALRHSTWESRAWCLQEKVFSKRLLILTESQAFFHCAAATWFEDTVLEPKDNIAGAIHMREQAVISRKLHSMEIPEVDRANYTAYEAHRKYFTRNFWSLVQGYSQRSLSHDSDALRAISGILKSIEPDFGPAIWGIPSYEFVRGLTWSHSEHCLDLRRECFPSWSWVGWRTNTNIHLEFKNCKRTDADLQVSEGRYRVAEGAEGGISEWNIKWWYHSYDKSSTRYILKPIARTPDELRVTRFDSTGNVKTRSSAAILREFFVQHYTNLPMSSLISRMLTQPRKIFREILFSKSGSKDAYAATSQPAASLDDTVTLPTVSTPLSLVLKPDPSHIIRFYTSVVKVMIQPDAKPSSIEHYGGSRDYCVFVSSDAGASEGANLGMVKLDRRWSGIGRTHTLIYISRWCPLYRIWNSEGSILERPEYLNVLLVESVEGWGEVKRRVQLLECVSLSDWRTGKPRWELMSLA